MRKTSSSQLHCCCGFSMCCLSLVHTFRKVVAPLLWILYMLFITCSYFQEDGCAAAVDSLCAVYRVYRSITLLLVSTFPAPDRRRNDRRYVERFMAYLHCRTPIQTWIRITVVCTNSPLVWTRTRIP